jgi:hypothetical protein
VLRSLFADSALPSHAVGEVKLPDQAGSIDGGYARGDAVVFSGRLLVEPILACKLITLHARSKGVLVTP